MIRLGIFLLWLLHFLPLAVLARLGAGAGLLFMALDARRRDNARTNLRLCFPRLGEGERQRLLRGHFKAFGRGILERGLTFWSSKERLRRIVRCEGVEHWEAVRGRPVILLVPHFVGLDIGGIRLSIDYEGVSMYSRQRNRAVDALLLRSRLRFGKTRLWRRQEGLRPLVTYLREGIPFYYLPDQDMGGKTSMFVPFFGVPAATITALPRLAKLGDAVVVPLVTRQLPGGRGYVARFYPAWENFPSDDLEADVRRMNAFIEERVREMPEQYWWLHRRFKTRPPGEPKLY
ncbi:MAG TPA: lysophospholipid acyltransferase family protein [Burkholderiales bacterium]|nr:lysophospholipid acyltransferase family protein [Burkholderiales bacterium]